MEKVRNLLIVDDSSTVRKIFSKIFSEEYSVFEAENGSEALKILRQNPKISCIVLDLNMPVLNGYEVLNTIKTDEKLKHVPVVIVTSDFELDSQVRALQGGAEEVITKPFNSEIVLHRINNIVRHHETLLENEKLRAEDSATEQKLSGASLDAYINGLEAKSAKLKFQPQYKYETNELCGAQVLANDDNELVWVHACTQISNWVHEGAEPVYLSVPISLENIEKDYTVALLKAIVNRYEIVPKLIHIEIPELLYVSHQNMTMKLVKELRDYGFVIEMTDFSFEFPLFNSQKPTPADIIKLNVAMDYFDTLAESGDNAYVGTNILNTVVRMAHWLKIPVITSGVKTRAEAQMLSDMGCRLMQGDLFAKPMDASEFKSLLSKEKHLFGEYNVPEIDVTNALDYFDVAAQAALLFNNFEGPAHIVSYDGNAVSSIRANEQFYELVGCSRAEYEEQKENFLGILYPESRFSYINALEKAIETKREQKCLLHSYPVGRFKNSTWLNNSVRFLSKVQDKHIFYVTIENVTVERENEFLARGFANIAMNIPAGVVAFEFIKDRICPLYISERTSEIYGFEREDYGVRISQLSIYEYVSSIGIKSLDDLTSLKTGESIDTTFLSKKRDGSIFLCRAITSCIKKNEDSYIIYSTIFDISNDYEQNTEMKLLREAYPGGMWKMKRRTGEARYISENLRSLLGYTREEIEEKFGGKLYLLAEGCNSPDELLQGKDTIELKAKDGTKKQVYYNCLSTTDIDGDEWIYVLITNVEE